MTSRHASGFDGSGRVNGRGRDISARPSIPFEGAREAAARLRVRDRARLSQLRLRLSASPEEVPFARAAITRLCEHLQIEDEQTERIRLAVTEACTNCVLHAYDERADSETYVLDARVDQQALRVTVCDSGVGIHNARANERPSLGYGLDLIEGLADSAEVSSRPSGGTRVVMRFAMRSAA
jgi:anti-sigma regulatory factor (Ser/Thr protein kinase)